MLTNISHGYNGIDNPSNYNSFNYNIDTNDILNELDKDTEKIKEESIKIEKPEHIKEFINENNFEFDSHEIFNILKQIITAPATPPPDNNNKNTLYDPFFEYTQRLSVNRKTRNNYWLNKQRDINNRYLEYIKLKKLKEKGMNFTITGAKILYIAGKWAIKFYLNTYLIGPLISSIFSSGNFLKNPSILEGFLLLLKSSGLFPPQYIGQLRSSFGKVSAEYKTFGADISVYFSKSHQTLVDMLGKTKPELVTMGEDVGSYIKQFIANSKSEISFNKGLLHKIKVSINNTIDFVKFLPGFSNLPNFGKLSDQEQILRGLVDVDSVSPELITYVKANKSFHSFTRKLPTLIKAKMEKFIQDDTTTAGEKLMRGREQLTKLIGELSYLAGGFVPSASTGMVSVRALSEMSASFKKLKPGATITTELKGMITKDVNQFFLGVFYTREFRYFPNKLQDLVLGKLETPVLFGLLGKSKDPVLLTDTMHYSGIDFGSVSSLFLSKYMNKLLNDKITPEDIIEISNEEKLQNLNKRIDRRAILYSEGGSDEKVNKLIELEFYGEKDEYYYKSKLFRKFEKLSKVKRVLFIAGGAATFTAAAFVAHDFASVLSRGMLACSQDGLTKFFSMIGELVHYITDYNIIGILPILYTFLTKSWIVVIQDLAKWWWVSSTNSNPKILGVSKQLIIRTISPLLENLKNELIALVSDIKKSVIWLTDTLAEKHQIFKRLFKSRITQIIHTLFLTLTEIGFTLFIERKYRDFHADITAYINKLNTSKILEGLSARNMFETVQKMAESKTWTDSTIKLIYDIISGNIMGVRSFLFGVEQQLSATTNTNPETPFGQIFIKKLPESVVGKLDFWGEKILTYIPGITPYHERMKKEYSRSSPVARSADMAASMFTLACSETNCAGMTQGAPEIIELRKEVMMKIIHEYYNQPGVQRAAMWNDIIDPSKDVRLGDTLFPHAAAVLPILEHDKPEFKEFHTFLQDKITKIKGHYPELGSFLDGIIILPEENRFEFMLGAHNGDVTKKWYQLGTEAFDKKFKLIYGTKILDAQALVIGDDFIGGPIISEEVKSTKDCTFLDDKNKPSQDMKHLIEFSRAIQEFNNKHPRKKKKIHLYLGKCKEQLSLLSGFLEELFSAQVFADLFKVSPVRPPLPAAGINTDLHELKRGSEQYSSLSAFDMTIAANSKHRAFYGPVPISSLLTINSVHKAVYDIRGNLRAQQFYYFNDMGDVLDDQRRLRDADAYFDSLPGLSPDGVDALPAETKALIKKDKDILMKYVEQVGKLKGGIHSAAHTVFNTPWRGPFNKWSLKRHEPTKLEIMLNEMALGNMNGANFDVEGESINFNNFYARNRDAIERSLPALKSLDIDANSQINMFTLLPILLNPKVLANVGNAQDKKNLKSLYKVVVGEELPDALGLDNLKISQAINKFIMTSILKKCKGDNNVKVYGANEILVAPTELPYFMGVSGYNEQWESILSQGPPQLKTLLEQLKLSYTKYSADTYDVDHFSNLLRIFGVQKKPLNAATTATGLPGTVEGQLSSFFGDGRPETSGIIFFGSAGGVDRLSRMRNGEKLFEYFTSGDTNQQNWKKNFSTLCHAMAPHKISKFMHLLDICSGKVERTDKCTEDVKIKINDKYTELVLILEEEMLGNTQDDLSKINKKYSTISRYITSINTYENLIEQHISLLVDWIRNQIIEHTAAGVQQGPTFVPSASSPSGSSGPAPAPAPAASTSSGHGIRATARATGSANRNQQRSTSTTRAPAQIQAEQLSTAQMTALDETLDQIETLVQELLESEEEGLSETIMESLKLAFSGLDDILSLGGNPDGSQFAHKKPSLGDPNFAMDELDGEIKITDEQQTQLICKEFQQVYHVTGNTILQDPANWNTVVTEFRTKHTWASTLGTENFKNIISKKCLVDIYSKTIKQNTFERLKQLSEGTNSLLYYIGLLQYFCHGFIKVAASIATEAVGTAAMAAVYTLQMNWPALARLAFLQGQRRLEGHSWSVVANRLGTGVKYFAWQILSLFRGIQSRKYIIETNGIQLMEKVNKLHVQIFGIEINGAKFIESLGSEDEAEKDKVVYHKGVRYKIEEFEKTDDLTVRIKRNNVIVNIADLRELPEPPSELSTDLINDWGGQGLIGAKKLDALKELYTCFSSKEFIELVEHRDDTGFGSVDLNGNEIPYKEVFFNPNNLMMKGLKALWGVEADNIDALAAGLETGWPTVSADNEFEVHRGLINYRFKVGGRGIGVGNLMESLDSISELAGDLTPAKRAEFKREYEEIKAEALDLLKADEVPQLFAQLKDTAEALLVWMLDVRNSLVNIVTMGYMPNLPAPISEGILKATTFIGNKQSTATALEKKLDIFISKYAYKYPKFAEIMYGKSTMLSYLAKKIHLALQTPSTPAPAVSASTPQIPPLLESLLDWKDSHQAFLYESHETTRRLFQAQLAEQTRKLLEQGSLSVLPSYPGTMIGDEEILLLTKLMPTDVATHILENSNSKKAFICKHIYRPILDYGASDDTTLWSLRSVITTNMLNVMCEDQIDLSRPPPKYKSKPKYLRNGKHVLQDFLDSLQEQYDAVDGIPPEWDTYTLIDSRPTTSCWDSHEEFIARMKNKGLWPGYPPRQPPNAALLKQFNINKPWDDLDKAVQIQFFIVTFKWNAAGIDALMHHYVIDTRNKTGVSPLLGSIDNVSALPSTKENSIYNLYHNYVAKTPEQIRLAASLLSSGPNEFSSDDKMAIRKLYTSALVINNPEQDAQDEIYLDWMKESLYNDRHAVDLRSKPHAATTKNSRSGLLATFKNDKTSTYFSLLLGKDKGEKSVVVNAKFNRDVNPTPAPPLGGDGSLSVLLSGVDKSNLVSINLLKFFASTDIYCDPAAPPPAAPAPAPALCIDDDTVNYLRMFILFLYPNMTPTLTNEEVKLRVYDYSDKSVSPSSSKTLQGLLKHIGPDRDKECDNYCRTNILNTNGFWELRAMMIENLEYQEFEAAKQVTFYMEPRSSALHQTPTLHPEINQLTHRNNYMFICKDGEISIIQISEYMKTNSNYQDIVITDTTRPPLIKKIPHENNQKQYKKNFKQPADDYFTPTKSKLQEYWFGVGGLFKDKMLTKTMKKLYNDSPVMDEDEKSEYDRSWPQGDLNDYWIDKKAYGNLPNCLPSSPLNEDEKRRAFTSYLRPIWGSVKDQYDINTSKGYHSLFRVTSASPSSSPSASP